MKKAHRLMIPLLAIISIFALLGASVVSAKVDFGDCWCGCGRNDPLCCDPPHAFKPDYPNNCGYGKCLGMQLKEAGGAHALRVPKD